MKISLATACLARAAIRRPPSLYRSVSKKAPMAAIVSDLSQLRATGATAFSRKDIEPVLWAGVFGSFAIGKQRPDSDVDVVVVYGPEFDDCQVAPDVPLLEDLLPQAWGRKVDVVNIVCGKELRGFISIESLLCSRTVYGSVEEPDVAAVREKAQDIFDSGLDNFKHVLDDVQKTKAMVEGVSKHQFDSSASIRDAVRENIDKILRSTTAHPRWHPMSEGFWYEVVERSVALREELEHLERGIGTVEGNSRFWEFVWETATATKLESLHGLGRRIERFVFPIFEDAQRKARVAQEIANGPGDSMNHTQRTPPTHKPRTGLIQQAELTRR